LRWSELGRCCHRDIWWIEKWKGKWKGMLVVLDIDEMMIVMIDEVMLYESIYS